MAQLRDRLADSDEIVEARRQKTQAVYAALVETYGLRVWNSSHDPLGELIMTILSQHTSDINSGRAFNNLLHTFKHDWLAIMNAPTDQVAAAIKSGGLANIKSKRIQEVLAEIYNRYGSLNLDFLDTLPLQAARDILNSFKGVGPKTTACVMMFSLGKPVLPVDTHVHRVSQRVGLIGPKVNAELAHIRLEAQLRPAQIYSFHVNMITHGRKVCKALRPLCEVCSLQEWCNYYHQVFLPAQRL